MARKNIGTKLEIKIDQILLRHRRVFLLDNINTESETKLIKQLTVLDAVNHKNILLTINSDGGFLTSGVNIINTFSMLKSPVLTLISGHACSMAALISICGDKRLMFKNSIWMMHPIAQGAYDYSSFVKDRIKNWDFNQTQVDYILKNNTKLIDKEIQEIKRGEKWFTAEECLKKGIVDKIL